MPVHVDLQTIKTTRGRRDHDDNVDGIGGTEDGSGMELQKAVMVCRGGRRRERRLEGGRSRGGTGDAGLQGREKGSVGSWGQFHVVARRAAWEDGGGAQAARSRSPPWRERARVRDYSLGSSRGCGGCAALHRS